MSLIVVDIIYIVLYIDIQPKVGVDRVDNHCRPLRIASTKRAPRHKKIHTGLILADTRTSNPPQKIESSSTPKT